MWDSSDMPRLDHENLAPHQIPLIYKQIGAVITSDDGQVAEGTLDIRPALRGVGGPSAAALAVLLQDISAVTISRYAPLNVPMVINVRIRDNAADVSTVFATGRTLQRGRSVMALDAVYYDADRPGTVIGTATGTWAAMDSYLAEPRQTRIGPGTQVAGDDPSALDFDDLLVAVGGRVRGDGTGVEMGEVPLDAPEPIALGGTGTGTLHAGALQVLAENAAVLAAEAAVDRSKLMIQGLSTQFIAPCRETPIAALGTVLAAGDGSVDVQVELHESGGAGRLTALSYARFALRD
jgi:acyl-coenzyme A thioesterase PaaI-like protein